MERFEISEVLDEAWTSTKKHYWQWLLVIFVAFVIPILLFVAGSAVSAWGAVDGSGFFTVLGVLIVLVALVGFFYVNLGIVRNSYFVSQGAKPSLGMLLQPDRFGWYLLTSLVYSGIIFLGLIAFVIPGLFFLVMFSLYVYAIVATKHMNGFAALGMSWDRVLRHFWGYLGLQVVILGFLVSVGVLAFLLQSLGLLTVTASGQVLVVLFGIVFLILLLLVAVFALAFYVTANAMAFRRLVGEYTEA
jgi:hypothetical protein